MMADACMTRSSVFSLQDTGWLSWRRATAVMEVGTETETWDDLSISHFVLVSHSQRSQSSMKDAIVSANLRALYDEVDKAPLYKYTFYTSRYLYIDCMRKSI